MDPHRLAEERSLAYHRAIATRLERDPSLLCVSTEADVYPKNRPERWNPPFFSIDWRRYRST